MSSCVKPSRDAATLIENLECAPCHFIGLSMGGFIGLRLAIHHPELIQSLILMNTSADPEPTENLGRYRFLNFIARWFGLTVVANRIMPIVFGQTFLTDPARTYLKADWRQRIIANDRIGITRATQGVITRQGIYEQLGQIKAPTLILVGDQDVATQPIHSERMHHGIPHSEQVIISGAGHTSTIEEPDAVNEALAEFLHRQSHSDDCRLLT